MSQANQQRERGNVEATECFAMSQIIEQSEVTLDTFKERNEIVLDTIGLRLPFKNKPLKCDWRDTQKNNNVILDKVVNKTKYRIDKIQDDEVKEFTGFQSLAAMIAYIVVITCGDIELMTEVCSPLNWFEEWLLCFDRVGGSHSPNG